MVNAPFRLLLAVSLVAVLPVPRAVAQGRVTTPREALGFDIGDDYRLATYTQLEAYWRTLAKQSSRMVLREIGKTAEDNRKPDIGQLIREQRPGYADQVGAEAVSHRGHRNKDDSIRRPGEKRPQKRGGEKQVIDARFHCMW